MTAAAARRPARPKSVHSPRYSLKGGFHVVGQSGIGAVGVLAEVVGLCFHIVGLEASGAMSRPRTFLDEFPCALPDEQPSVGRVLFVVVEAGGSHGRGCCQQCEEQCAARSPPFRQQIGGQHGAHGEHARARTGSQDGAGRQGHGHAERGPQRALAVFGQVQPERQAEGQGRGQSGRIVEAAAGRKRPGGRTCAAPLQQGVDRLRDRTKHDGGRNADEMGLFCFPAAGESRCNAAQAEQGGAKQRPIDLGGGFGIQKPPGDAPERASEPNREVEERQNGHGFLFVFK